MSVGSGETDLPGKIVGFIIYDNLISSEVQKFFSASPLSLCFRSVTLKENRTERERFPSPLFTLSRSDLFGPVKKLTSGTSRLTECYQDKNSDRIMDHAEALRQT